MMSIMDSLGNHFIRSMEKKEIAINNNVLSGDFSNKYLAGMYIIIKGSYLNDGIYQIVKVEGNNITCKGDLVSEVSDMTIYASTPPKEFIRLIEEIKGYNETVGVVAESIDDYSVTYKSDGSAENVYSAKLNKYRNVYSDYLRWR